MGQGMLVEQVRRALAATPRGRLAELAATVWRAFAAGAISEEDAQQLAEEIAVRKAIPAAPPAPRRVGSRPRSPASMERRRAWAASSWLPPRIAARFTPAEQAALGVVLAEIAMTGRSELCHGAVAGRAGVSVSTVKRAMAEARRLGLVLVEERRISRFRNDTNVVTILSAELRTWVATRGRGLRAARGTWGQGGGVHVGTTTESISLILSSKAERTTPSQACRGARGIGSAQAGHRTSPVERGSTSGCPGAPQSRSEGRRVS